MGSPRITMFIVALLVVGFIASSFMLFTSGLINFYGNSTYENTTTLQNLNQLSSLESQAKQIRSDTSNVSTSGFLENVFDNLFGTAYNVVKTTGSSIETFESITSASLDSNLGDVGINLKNMIIAIVSVLIFLGVIIAIIIRTKTGEI